MTSTFPFIHMSLVSTNYRVWIFTYIQPFFFMRDRFFGVSTVINSKMDSQIFCLELIKTSVYSIEHMEAGEYNRIGSGIGLESLLHPLLVMRLL